MPCHMAACPASFVVFKRSRSKTQCLLYFTDVEPRSRCWLYRCPIYLPAWQRLMSNLGSFSS